MIYLDSAAIVKLIRRETETAALHAWLTSQQDKVLVASTNPGRHSPGQRPDPAAEGLPLTALVTYDKRLLAAATEVGLATAAPGAESPQY